MRVRGHSIALAPRMVNASVKKTKAEPWEAKAPQANRSHGFDFSNSQMLALQVQENPNWDHGSYPIEIKGHKNILSNNSVGFDRVFTGGFKETPCKVIGIHWDDPNMVYFMVKYLYIIQYDVDKVTKFQRCETDARTGEFCATNITHIIHYYYKDHAQPDSRTGPAIAFVAYENQAFVETKESEIEEYAKVYRMFAADIIWERKAGWSFKKESSRRSEGSETNPHGRGRMGIRLRVDWSFPPGR
ncbi:hypothetical protein K469DRAFT_687625 [Zopfia rhizophila CBS 207.26]|uniref:BTB domain-containing protein n=1 Tax=Zopfia rhizophila CBS 207.26 TaxID=1314779 RepID=A0A6A6E3N5_9PEZI|nr:hypothetical protein K469DRAFT_687625 [Zopfia rhizophila CBS 207.26]